MTSTINGHQFAKTTWPAADLVLMAKRGELMLMLPDQGRSSLAPATVAATMIPAAKRAVRNWLTDTNFGSSILVNDRMPDIGDERHEGRYVVIDGQHKIESFRLWFDSEIHVPADWFPPDCVERTITTNKTPVVFMDLLTDTGRRLISDKARVRVSIGTLPTVEDEREVYLYLNSQNLRPTRADLDRARAYRTGNDDIRDRSSG